RSDGEDEGHRSRGGKGERDHRIGAVEPAEVRDDLARGRRARRGPLEGHGYAGSPTTASISTFMPGIASALTSTSVLAGRASPKNSWRTGLMRARSPISVR